MKHNTLLNSKSKVPPLPKKHICLVSSSQDNKEGFNTKHNSYHLQILSHSTSWKLLTHLPPPTLWTHIKADQVSWGLEKGRKFPKTSLGQIPREPSTPHRQGETIVQVFLWILCHCLRTLFLFKRSMWDSKTLRFYECVRDERNEYVNEWSQDQSPCVVTVTVSLIHLFADLRPFAASPQPPFLGLHLYQMYLSWGVTLFPYWGCLL